MRMILAALSERAAADRRKCCAMTPVRSESQSGRPPGTTRRIVQPPIFYIKFHWWRMLHKVEIVENDMDFLALILLDDAVHEIAELHPAAAFVVPSRDLTGADVERGEQGRGAVSLVVVRLAGHRPAIRQLQISLRD